MFSFIQDNISDKTLINGARYRSKSPTPRQVIEQRSIFTAHVPALILRFTPNKDTCEFRIPLRVPGNYIVYVADRFYPGLL